MWDQELGTICFSLHHRDSKVGMNNWNYKAEDLGLNSVSFPVISAENINSTMTATIMLMAIKAFIEENNSTLLHL